MRGRRKQFFLEKKNQETSTSCAHAYGKNRDSDTKVFCVFSSEKKTLLFLFRKHKEPLRRNRKRRLHGRWPRVKTHHLAGAGLPACAPQPCLEHVIDQPRGKPIRCNFHRGSMGKADRCTARLRCRVQPRGKIVLHKATLIENQNTVRQVPGVQPVVADKECGSAILAHHVSDQRPYSLLRPVPS
jgi:hypothetical protein